MAATNKAHPRALFLDNSDLSVAESVAALDALLAQAAATTGPVGDSRLSGQNVEQGDHNERGSGA
ncbi:MAG: hypothetical protein R3A10_11515 [Caldilineaceae bacterium]